MSNRGPEAGGAIQLEVREMLLSEIPLRIEYFHSADDGYLEMLGVDRALLPTREAWLAQYERDAALPLEQRPSVQLIWLGDGKPIGFSSVDRITIGEQAFMHLHILEADNRSRGIGLECVRRSVDIYFDMLRLKRLFCQPNAFNTAPNRTLQRAGFRYVETFMGAPSPINYHQALTRWVIERPDAASAAGA